MKHIIYKSAALALLSAFALCGCGSSPDAPSAADSSSSDAPSAADSSSSDASSAADSSSEEQSDDALTIGIAPMTAKPGQKRVPVDVEIWNTPGYTGAGFQIGYDPALKPYTAGTQPGMDLPDAEIIKGSAAEGFLTSCMVGEEVKLIAFGCMGMEAQPDDGVIFTCFFDVPTDAAVGTEYHFPINIDSVTTEESDNVKCSVREGVLTIN